MLPPKINLTGQISHFFASNRPLSSLLLIVSLLLGLVTFFLTPKQYNPDITRPAFLVTLTYPGADTNKALDRVVYELVEKINTIPGVDDVYSEVKDGAEVNTTVIFEVGYDAAKAKLDLTTQLNQHGYLAEGKINQPHIIEINPETIPVLQIAFGSKELAITELREKVQRLAQVLGQIENISELQVYGGYETALVVEVDPNLLKNNHISLAEVKATLMQNQQQILLPSLRSDTNIIDVMFSGAATSPAAVGDLLIRDDISIRDIAQVYEGVRSERTYVVYQDNDNYGEVIILSAAKVEGSSAPTVTADFLNNLSGLINKPEFSGLEYQIIGNDGAMAEAEIFGLTKNLISSVLIVAFVLLLFLSIRAAIVVLVSIPVTLLLVFGLGYFFDQTINRITLFALILSLGLLVDSTIVAVENMYAHLRQTRAGLINHTREQIIAKAIDEIGIGLLLSTLTSVIVFLPMNYITGMMGPYMGPIAFFVPAALLISFLVAIVVTPFIANHILQVEEKPNRLTAVFSLIIEKLIIKYKKILTKILFNRHLQKRLLQIALVIFLLSLLLPILGLVHFQMLPKADRDQFYIYLDLPVGTDREVTKKATTALVEEILTDVDVLSTQQFIATSPVLDFNGMFKGAQNREAPEQATIRVNLKSATDRERSSTEIVSSIRTKVINNLSSLIQAIRFIEEPPGPPVRSTLVAKIASQNVEEQRKNSLAFKNFISGVSGVVDTYASDEAKIGRVRYVFDAAAADNLGVSAKDVTDVLMLIGRGIEVEEFVSAKKIDYTPITVRLPSYYMQSPNVIDVLTVANQAGEQIPLRSIIKVEYEERPTVVYLEDMQQLTYVTAEVQNRSIVYVTIEIIKKLIAGDLVGYTVTDWNLWGLKLKSVDGLEINLSWGGEWEMTLENFRDLGIAMGVALLMVYVLLVAQYNSFSIPAYILVTVPLGLVGILWGFLFLDVGFDIYLTATALIGFIALIGLVVNNAIIYLEYVEQAQASGQTYIESLLAAGEARLRPIFLTSLTTILGSLTIANDPVWSGLAWSIIFGLSLSTILTLIIYPTLLVYFNQQK